MVEETRRSEQHPNHNEIEFMDFGDNIVEVDVDFPKSEDRLEFLIRRQTHSLMYMYCNEYITALRAHD